MNILLAIAAGIGVIALGAALRRTDTRIGRAIRDSDHQAWQWAVDQKRRELADLERAEPRR